MSSYDRVEKDPAEPERSLSKQSAFWMSFSIICRTELSLASLWMRGVRITTLKFDFEMTRSRIKAMKRMIPSKLHGSDVTFPLKKVSLEKK